ncbi:MAG: cobyrinate a,c-diamide synthase [Syntrophorhabdales bacterium]|jgi:cobyrinic acid a,c-diamide synthase
MRGLVIGGTHSGCGKTTVTLGVLAALRKKGHIVQPFKAGPDFIDSGLHRIAAGRVSRNLDLWMCGAAYVKESFHRNGSDADIAVVEGVMGLYDGYLSTAALAAVIGAPVVLVVDAYGMAESAGALIAGFRDWRPEGAGPTAEVKGVIFSRVASNRHYERLAAGVKGVALLGYLPRDGRFEIPHRHLGLVVAEEEPVSSSNLDRLADAVLSFVDIDALLSLSASCAPLPQSQTAPMQRAGAARGDAIRVAVASDRAFCFYYQDNIDLLKEAGAEIVFFSPLADKGIPEGADAVYIGGGYPELHGEALSQNIPMRRAIGEWADSDRPLYAECGGLMYLSRTICDFQDHAFPMTGVFPFETMMGKERAHLGYREVSLARDCILGRKGERARGHEFRYSEIAEAPETGGSYRPERVYAVTDGSGADLAPEGYQYRNTLGSYIHVHFGSNPAVAQGFIDFVKKGAAR